jgi:pimeloyl-ACP methyl ester carboxylesterase
LAFLRLFPTKVKAVVLVDAYLPQAAKDDAAREQQKKQMDGIAQRWRAPNYRESAAAMIESMFSDQTTPAQREEIRTRMLATPQHVMASAFEGMLALEPRPEETFAVPAMAVVAETSRNAGQEAQLRAVFPNLRTYEGWQGSGHFLMIESPGRFNRALEAFLTALP